MEMHVKWSATLVDWLGYAWLWDSNALVSRKLPMFFVMFEWDFDREAGKQYQTVITEALLKKFGKTKHQVMHRNLPPWLGHITLSSSTLLTMMLYGLH